MLQSLYLKTADLNWLKGSAYPTSTDRFVSLHSADPFLAGSDQIAVGRQPVTTWSAIANNTKRIAQDLDWGAASINASATHWGLWDASTGGNFLGGGKLKDLDGVDYTLSIVTGSTIFIPQNVLIVGYGGTAFANYFINKKLNWLSGTAFGTPPSALYGAFGLSLLLDGSGAYMSIARQPIPFGANVLQTDYLEMANNTTVNFANSNAVATINGCGIFDASTSGNLIMLGSFSSIDLIVGTQLFLNPNSIKIQC